ncbi:TPA: TraC family protein [Escherichia coli]|nr:TraC family protein [Escherichia coli]
MSNNPLEAVTQTVNSLVTALKLPDESAKANEVLGEMSFPQFSRLLPYRDYNQESGLFMNDTTMGFMRKRKLTAVCSHQTRIGNLDAHLI